MMKVDTESIDQKWSNFVTEKVASLNGLIIERPKSLVKLQKENFKIASLDRILIDFSTEKLLPPNARPH